MSVVESIVNDFIQWTYTVYVTFNNPRREWDGTLTPVVAILLPTPHCALALAFRHLPEPCLRAVRFFVFRPCSIGGLYILTDTGTADLEVLLDVNVLKNTFGGAATLKPDTTSAPTSTPTSQITSAPTLAPSNATSLGMGTKEVRNTLKRTTLKNWTATRRSRGGGRRLALRALSAPCITCSRTGDWSMAAATTMEYTFVGAATIKRVIGD